jgi:hypothetical protein
MKKYILLFSLFLCVFANAEEAKKQEEDKLKISLLGFISAETEIDNGELTNTGIKMDRAYLTLKKQAYGNLSMRMTVDTYEDDDGLELRFKYFYGLLDVGDWSVFTKNEFEFGMVQTPYLDFEQSINRYRVQGKMFAERAKLTKSADLGLVWFGNFGGQMSKEYTEKVKNKKYAGQYGSYALGVYNGAGYNGNNENKSVAAHARISFRPLPAIIPGLQFSYSTVLGEGNSPIVFDIEKEEEFADWQNHYVMTTYESSSVTLIGQYLFGKGNMEGDNYMPLYTDDKITDFQTGEFEGASIFAEYKISESFSLMGRYDYLDLNVDIDNDIQRRMIAGVAYLFDDINMLVLDVETTKNDKESTDKTLLKLSMQIKI